VKVFIQKANCKLPIEIVYKEKFIEDNKALKREKQIKSWSRNKKKH